MPWLSFNKSSGDLFQPGGYSVSVLWPHARQGAQNDEIEGALQHLDA